MDFRIADTFTASLTRLTGDEQKAVKTTAFDLQLDPANPGMQFHKLDRAKDKSFWSVRVNRDIRLIVHKNDTGLLLCYVGHHDDAYSWAERRKIERHPKTGAAQLVEIRETVQEIAVQKYVDHAKPTKKKKLFAKISQETLLGYGVPQEWLSDVLAADEDSLFELTEHLPSEAAEALLSLAIGETPKPIEPIAKDDDPFAHPDAQRRFRLMGDAEELAQALDYPWEKWAVFLHPTQREIVKRNYAGPARVAGTAGTGKTVVALHRAVHLAQTNPNARILVTTFNEILASSLIDKLRHLIGNSPRVFERIEVYSLDKLGERLYRSRFGQLNLASDQAINEILAEVSKNHSHSFSDSFIRAEWRDVVDAWQLDTWDAYREVPRLGRKSRLREAQRSQLWAIFSQTRQRLSELGLITRAQLFAKLAVAFVESNANPYASVIVDEAQDIGIAELKFLAALGAGKQNGLFLAGDLGQRIFQQPFSWKALGVDVRGRSKSLRINYRTSHQIRWRADFLLPSEVQDVDGNSEVRGGTISAFNGPQPLVAVYKTIEQETQAIADWLRKSVAGGIRPHEIGVFVRTPLQYDRALRAVELAGLAGHPITVLEHSKEGIVPIMTMHMAKGLEYRAVAVMACDDEVLPLQERLAAVTDDSDLEEVYNTERHLLYVACTRARDELMVSGSSPASEFLDDLVEH